MMPKKTKKRRKFYKLKEELDINANLKKLIFKRKHGFFVDKDEDIFIKDTESYHGFFQEFVFNETNYKI